MNWNQIQNFLSNLVFIMLLFETVLYWGHLTWSDPSSRFLKISQFFTLITNLFLIIILGSRWIVAGYFPLSNLYESLLFLTCMLLSMQLILQILIKSRLTGAIIIPVSLLISAFANLTLSPEMQKASPLVPALQSNWLMMHVTVMLISYALLIIGSALCILYLIIEDSINYYVKQFLLTNSSGLNIQTIEEIIKNADVTQNHTNFYQTVGNILKKGNNLNKIQLYPYLKLLKLKVLELLDNLTYKVIGFGFPFLTLGIISGAVWANEAWGSYWSWDPKETWALITWLIFASYLHARITKGWYGKNAALIGAIGFPTIWVCYLGVNFLGKGLHSYGWL